MEYTGGYRNERIEEWMEQQEVSSYELFCGCCDPQSVKRRKARYVVYKQLVLEEIEKRCQKYEDKLLPEEKEAIEEVKEKFSRGNYCNIEVTLSSMGTFYTPVSLILYLISPEWLLFILFPRVCVIYYIISELKLKDDHRACSTYTVMIPSLLYCLLLLPFLGDIFYIFVIPLSFILPSLIELTMLAASIVFCYGFYFLSHYGFFHYRFRIYLVQRKFDKQDVIYRTICHGPFRRIYSQPIRNIFKDMSISTYDFGEINGQLVTQDGINNYNRYYLKIRDETHII